MAPQNHQSLIERVFGPISKTLNGLFLKLAYYVYDYPYWFIFGGIVFALLLALGVLVAPPAMSDTIAWVPRSSPLLLDFGFSSIFFNLVEGSNTDITINVTADDLVGAGVTADGAPTVLTKAAMLAVHDVATHILSYKTEVSYYPCVAGSDCNSRETDLAKITLGIPETVQWRGPPNAETDGWDDPGTNPDIPVHRKVGTMANLLSCVWDYDRGRIEALANDEEVVRDINAQIARNREESTRNIFCDPLLVLDGVEYDTTDPTTIKITSAQASRQQIIVGTNPDWAEANPDAGITPWEVWHDHLMESLGYYANKWSADALWQDLQSTKASATTLEDIQEALYAEDPDLAMRNLSGGIDLMNSGSGSKPTPTTRTKDGKWYLDGITVSSSRGTSANGGWAFGDDIKNLAVGLVIAVVFSAVALSKFTRAAPLLHTRFSLLLGGLFATLLSIIASYGIIGLCDLATSTINVICPCLSVALALDDIFVTTAGVMDAFNARRAALRQAGLPCRPDDRFYRSRVLHVATNTVIEKAAIGWVDADAEVAAARTAARRVRAARRRRVRRCEDVFASQADIDAEVARIDAHAALVRAQLDANPRHSGGEYIDLSQFAPRHVFAEAYADAISAILMTKSTTFLSFLVSAISDIEAITSFAVHCFSAVLVLFIEIAVVHGPFVRLDQIRIEQGRADIFSCIRLRPAAATASRVSQWAPVSAGEEDIMVEREIANKLSRLSSSTPMSSSPAPTARFTEVSPTVTPAPTPMMVLSPTTATIELVDTLVSTSAMVTEDSSSLSSDADFPGVNSPPLPDACIDIQPATTAAAAAATTVPATAAAPEKPAQPDPLDLSQPSLHLTRAWQTWTKVNEYLSLDYIFTMIAIFTTNRIVRIILLSLMGLVVVAGMPFVLICIKVGSPFDLTSVLGTTGHYQASVQDRYAAELPAAFNFSIPTIQGMKNFIPNPNAATPATAGTLTLSASEELATSALTAAGYTPESALLMLYVMFDGYGDPRVSCADLEYLSYSPMARWEGARYATQGPAYWSLKSIFDDFRDTAADACDVINIAASAHGSLASANIPNSFLDISSIDIVSMINSMPPFTYEYTYRQGILQTLRALQGLRIWPALPDRAVPAGARGLAATERAGSVFDGVSSRFSLAEDWVSEMYTNRGCDVLEVAGGTPCTAVDYDENDIKIPSFVPTSLKSYYEEYIIQRRSDPVRVTEALKEVVTQKEWFNTWSDIYIEDSLNVMAFGRIPIYLSTDIKSEDIRAIRSVISPTLANNKNFSSFVLDKQLVRFFFAEIDAAITPAAIQGIALSALAVFIVNLLLLASLPAALIAVVGTLLVNVIVLIVMTLLGFELEAMSSTTLILGSGLSVDIIVHLSHMSETFLKSRLAQLTHAAVEATEEGDDRTAYVRHVDQFETELAMVKNYNTRASRQLGVTQPPRSIEDAENEYLTMISTLSGVHAPESEVSEAPSRRQSLINQRLTRHGIHPGSAEHCVAYSVSSLGPSLAAGWATTVLVIVSMCTANMKMIHIFYRQLFVIMLSSFFCGFFVTPAALTVTTSWSIKRHDRKLAKLQSNGECSECSE